VRTALPTSATFHHVAGFARCRQPVQPPDARSSAQVGRRVAYIREIMSRQAMSNARRPARLILVRPVMALWSRYRQSERGRGAWLLISIRFVDDSARPRGPCWGAGGGAMSGRLPPCREGRRSVLTAITCFPAPRSSRASISKTEGSSDTRVC